MAAGVPVLTPRKAGDPDFLARLAELQVDCCPVVAYGVLLPTAALAIPPHGWVNLHFSLLPAWRGAAPQWQRGRIWPVFALGLLLAAAYAWWYFAPDTLPDAVRSRYDAFRAHGGR